MSINKTTHPVQLRKTEAADGHAVGLRSGWITVEFPPLHHPDAKIADRGKVRLGDGIITAEFPPLRHPDAKIADRGKVRLGDGIIAGRQVQITVDPPRTQ